MPFALEELDILGKCNFRMWALIRRSADRAGEPMSKLDIELCDDQGIIQVRIKGLWIQAITATTISTPVGTIHQNNLVSRAQEGHELMTFEEVWQEQAIPDTTPVKMKNLVCFLSNPENQQTFIETMAEHDQQTQVILIAQSTAYQKQSQSMYNICRAERHTYQEAFANIREEYGELDGILYLWPLEDSSCIEDYSGPVYLLQAIASTKLKVNRVLFGTQFKNGLERCYLESWIGFERSLGLVLTNTPVVLINQEAHELNRETVPDWVQKLRGELRVPQAQSVLYQDGKRHICRIRPTTIPSREPSGNGLWRPGGAYLITGGCGGLGLLFAEHLVRSSSGTEPVNLILNGRSPLDVQKQMKIKTLEDLGCRVMYVQADVSDPDAMKEGLNRARERFGSINGVIHAAGIAGNQIIFAKEIPDFQKVLDPKIKGILVLDELLRDEPLDFICCFSSSSAILGDFGSCDYAIANRFLMAYTHYRNQLHHEGKRPGKAVVINWPLWKDGGMGFGDERAAEMYLKSSGQRYLETEEGLVMFDRILAQHNAQHLILVGQPSRVKRFLGLTEEQPAMLSSSTSGGTRIHKRGKRVEMKGLSVAQCLEWDLKEYISQILKISRDKIDRDENLTNFGFDSISLTQYADLLTKHYGIEITPALFFGYATLEKLAQYFLTEHQEVIQELYREEVAEPVISPRAPVIGITPERLTGRSRFTAGNTPSVSEPIAIIGMSGRFPEARNIEELWAILAAGREAVREIPAERFDWRQYYGDPDKEPGKTNCKWCGCLSGVSEFDPLFFEISPREAEIMDPRQRLLLQESWKALEDAGYGAEQIKTKKIGMFVGVEQGDYQLLVKEER